MFRYYGSKRSFVNLYPAPEHDTIVEPFAGAASYAMCHWRKNVLLIERDPSVARLWRWLISVDEREILRLPDARPGLPIAEMDCEPIARELIARCVKIQGMPAKQCSRFFWCDQWQSSGSLWGPRMRMRIARDLHKIRHWRVLFGDYTDAPDISATWFVDPPYSELRAGNAYAHGASHVDFVRLAAWSRARRGLTIVCNGAGDWLPFRDLSLRRNIARDSDSGVRHMERVWINRT